MESPQHVVYRPVSMAMRRNEQHVYWHTLGQPKSWGGPALGVLGLVAVLVTVLFTWWGGFLAGGATLLATAVVLGLYAATRYPRVRIARSWERARLPSEEYRTYEQVFEELRSLRRGMLALFGHLAPEHDEALRERAWRVAQLLDQYGEVRVSMPAETGPRHASDASDELTANRRGELAMLEGAIHAELDNIALAKAELDTAASLAHVANATVTGDPGWLSLVERLNALGVGYGELRPPGAPPLGALPPVSEPSPPAAVGTVGWTMVALGRIGRGAARRPAAGKVDQRIENLWGTRDGRSTSGGRRWPWGFLALLLVLAAVVGGLMTWQPWREPQLRGLAFAPFRDCQSPEREVFPSPDQMRQDVDLIGRMGNGVRTYSSRNGTAEAAEYAYAAGLRVSAGAWLGREDTAEQRAANQQEVDAVIALAKRVRLESVIVGSEVVLRDDLPPGRLAEYIRAVRDQVSVPVTTADTPATAVRPDYRVVVDAVDHLMIHVHPYWDGVGVEDAAEHVARVHDETGKALGKKVVVGETGWPSGGQVKGAAVPSPENAHRFLSEWVPLADRRRIDYYYFSAFDEKWKREDGGVGRRWGLWDSARRPKYPTAGLLAKPSTSPARTPVAGQPATGGASGTGGPPVPPAAGITPLVLYHNWPGGADYVPSGFIGDTADVTFDDCAKGGRDGADDPAAIDYAIRVDYRPSGTGQGSAGGYWQHVTNKGARRAGPDLRGFTRLSFYARGDSGGEKVRFFVGGITGQPGTAVPDSLAKHDLSVTLTPDWTNYVIDLTGADLSRVAGGFGWSAAKPDNPLGASFYLDDIQFEKPRQPCLDSVPGASPGSRYVLDGRTLCAPAGLVSPYHLEVDTSGGLRDWLRSDRDALTLNYPGQQQWGAAFITVGPPVPPGDRPGQDLSRCRTIEVDLRADTPGATLGIGMKDQTMPDDGTETKIRVSPTDAWQTMSFELTAFQRVDLSAVYVVIELVFEASDPPQAVQFRDVRLLCG